jgi:hypothetical protein
MSPPRNDVAPGTGRGRLDNKASGGLAELISILTARPKHPTLRDAFQVGEAVALFLYDGDVTKWRQSRRDPNYLALSSASNLPISKAELYRSLRVFELGTQYPTFVSDDALTLSHFLSVLSLRPDEQVGLLRLAREQSWSVRQLRAVVSKKVEGSDAVPSGTGRPRVPAVVKTLRGPLASDAAFDGIETLLAVDEVTAKQLMEVCRKTRVALDRIEDTLRIAGAVGRHQRVMVIDESGAFTARAQKELRKYVRSVRVAHSCEQALQRIDAQIACVAISLHLPDGCALQLSGSLKARYPQLRCVYTTRVPRSELAQELRSAFPLVTLTSGLRLLATVVLDALDDRHRTSGVAQKAPQTSDAI